MVDDPTGNAQPEDEPEEQPDGETQEQPAGETQESGAETEAGGGYRVSQRAPVGRAVREQPKPELLKPEEFDKIPSGVDGDTIKDLESPKTSTWNREKHAAQVQASLAFRLIWVLAGVLAGGAILLVTSRWTAIATKDVTSFFGIAFGAVVTLTTAATSFWFGSQRGNRPPD